MKSKSTNTTSQPWMPYPKPVDTRGGYKVDWNYYADEATARECAKAASNNRDIMMQRGYDFGYCWPSTVQLVDVAPEGRTELVGLWEVCLP